jgi:hypothetical protein
LPCSCGQNAALKRRGDKTVLSSIGHIRVSRRYYACRHCKAKQTPWDVWAGVHGVHRVTRHARRMIVLAGSSCSFDGASTQLNELCRIQVSNDVIRRVCDEEGERVRRWMTSSPALGKAFSAGTGVVEFSTDGVKLNTVGGWREMRLSVMSKREAGQPAPPAQWADRPLNDPSVRIAICAIAPCGHIGASWQRLAKLLGLSREQTLSVLADGARWIWEQAAKRFKGADVQWVVDVYHVLLYLFAAGAAALGEGSTAATGWAGQRMIELIEMGGPRFIEHLKSIGPPGDTPAAARAWDKLLNYLSENRDSLWYGARLAQGLPIGSGLIEGGCKNTLGKRLKLNNARWRVRRAERMGAIRCLQYSGMWESYWEEKHAA